MSPSVHNTKSLKFFTFYNPDIIADEFKTYSVALETAVLTNLVVCSGSEAADVAT